MSQYAHIDNEEFFFSWVYIPFLKVIHEFEKFLRVDLQQEIFQKAIELGYNREQATEKITENQSRYTHPSYNPIRLSTIQNNFCREAFFSIIQDKIKESQMDSTAFKILDLRLANYDPIIPENYLKPVPEDITLPLKNSENWLNFELDVPERIPDNDDFFTLYAQHEVRYVDLTEELHEYEEMATSFISNSVLAQIKNGVKYLEVDDLIRYPKTRTISQFKNLEELPDKRTPFEQMICVCKNIWNLHSNNKLVRLYDSFIKENNLQWQSILNLTDGKEKIINFECWCGPYNGSQYSRDRIANGVRLQIKTSFLLDYMKKTKKSLILIKEKSRKKFKPSLYRDEIKELGSEKNKKVAILSC